jgi:tetratricopeptide (TPR) repeat protein
LALARDAGSLCFLIASLALCGVGERRKVIWIVAGSIGTMAVVALAHAAFGATRVFGVYEPLYARPPLLAPLLNGNHLAGLMALGIPMMLVAGFTAERMLLRFLWLGAAAASALAAAMSGSRGGAVAVVLGACASVLILRFDRTKEPAAKTQWMLAAGAVSALGVGLISYVLLHGKSVVDRTVDIKWSLTRAAFKFAVHDVPWVGIGRGSFGAVFAREAYPAMRPTHAENLIAQWWSDWGLMFGSVLVIVLLFDAARSARGPRSALRVAAGIGLAALVAQNMVDYGLEVSGVSSLAAITLGAWLAPVSKPSKPSRSSQRSTRTYHAVGNLFGLGAALTATVAIVLAGGLHEQASLPVLQGAVQGALGGRDDDAFQQTLDRALLMHPAEPSLFLLGTSERRLHDAAELPQWLARTKRLAPGWPQPHMEEAAWHMMHGRVAAAAAALGRAGTLDLYVTGPFACQLASAYREPQLLLSALPVQAPTRRAFLAQSSRCLDPWSTVALAVDPVLLASGPLDAEAVRREARRRMHDRDFAAATALLTKACAQDPNNPPLAALLGRALLAQGQAERALDWARKLEKRVDSPRLIDVGLEMRARAYAAQRQLAEMSRALDELHARKYGSAESLAEAFELRGELEAQVGRSADALVAYEQAVELAPTPRALSAAAALSDKLGMHHRAHEHYRELCSRDPRQSKACAKAAEKQQPILDALRSSSH